MKQVLLSLLFMISYSSWSQSATGYFNKALKKAEQQPRNCVRSYLTEDAVSNISWQAYGQRYNEFLLKVTTNK